MKILKYELGAASYLPAIIVVVSVAIFIVDILTPLWYADWIFYIIPLLLTSWLPSQRRYLFFLALLLPLLIVAGFFFSPLSHFPGPVTRAAINRTTGTLALWLMIALLVLRRNAVNKLRQAHQQLENKVQERTAELKVTNEQLKKENQERMVAEQKIARYSATLEKKVGERTKKLVNAERLKSEFIADASHELRTPLAIIKSNVDLALGKKSRHLINPHEALAKINSEVSGISRIISELTAITQYGQTTPRGLSLEKIHLKKLLITLVEKYSVLIRNKMIGVHVNIPPSLIVHGDREKLEKLFNNLIVNALRYGKKSGYLRITARKIEDSVTIDFRDNGTGIPSHDLPHIFERFYRVDKTRNRDGGVGLGLAICKEIAETHGGKITVVSTYGKGSVFSVVLPTKGK
jgi:signal transduction histidine kinase